MFFNIPYLAPQAFDAGLQVYNPGTGGPASHPREQASVPHIWPTAYRVQLMGMAMIPPRQVLGPTPVINVNQLAGMTQNLQIAGLQKAGNG